MTLDATLRLWKERGLRPMCANPYVFGREATLLSRLKQLNIEPSEIRYVVASHLHLDHAGGLHLFPQAVTYVQEQELLKTLKDMRMASRHLSHGM